jgi:hypothetical protein
LLAFFPFPPFLFFFLPSFIMVLEDDLALIHAKGVLPLSYTPSL